MSSSTVSPSSLTGWPLRLLVHSQSTILFSQVGLICGLPAEALTTTVAPLVNISIVDDLGLAKLTSS